MAFQVLYPDVDLVFDLSATPATKSTVNSAGIAVELDGEATKSHVQSAEIKVYNPTSGVAIESVMDNGSVYSANTESATSARISSLGKMLISENLTVNSFMDASGVSFVNGANTASFASADGISFNSAPVNYDAGAGATSVVGGASAEFTSGANVGTFSATQAKVDDGTNQARLASTSLAFGLDAPMSPVVTIGSADGLLLTSGPLQPSELYDTAGSTAGSSGQFLTSTGSGTEWVTYSPSTPNLATVLAVATAGDANDLPISNLANLDFALSAVGQTALSITGAASSAPGSVADVLSVNYAVDATSARPFTNQYIEIKIAGTSYWMPLFGVPAGP
jgi:hypothetical protein